jgi:hypothetical protein
VTKPKPKYQHKDTAELAISAGEEKLLRTLRRGIRGAGRRPYVLTVVATGDVLQLWGGVPAGDIRDRKLTSDD